MTEENNYQYPIKALPVIRPYGGNASTNAAIPGLESPNVPLANWMQAEGPFGDPSVDGGGGGGGVPSDCAATGLLGTLNVGEIGLPCDTPRSLIGANAIALEDESGNTCEVSAVNGRFVISFTGSKSISIAAADLPDGAVAMFREFTNCDGLTWYALATEPA